MENLLEAKDLSVDFLLDRQRIHAVRGVGLHIRPQETVVVAGESGSGKTVTALALTRVLPANARIISGSVSFSGKDLLTLSEKELQQVRGSKIAYCFQEPSSYLNPVYTIAEQIGEALRYHQGLTGRAAKDEAAQLLIDVMIADPGRVLDSYPHQLSGGMNQRVFLAMSLACRPGLLICDEPTTALDVTIEAQILQLLMHLKEKHGFALLFITHNLAIARKIAQRIYVMYQGAVVEEGATRDIFSAGRHAHTQELIAAYEKIGRL